MVDVFLYFSLFCAKKILILIDRFFDDCLSEKTSDVNT